MTIKVTYNITDVYMSQSVSPVYINVSYSDGGASGGGVWGSITGTLSNQTDLQTALDAKLDESTIDGGTEGQILSKASATDFDFAWINNYAKYLATNVRNQSGSTIGAFQVVYISGATGNKPLISLADADTEATSSKTYGVTAMAIANNGTGDVVTAGELSGIDTSAFNEGDLLWLSTTAGGVVTSPPAEPAHAVFIGIVIRSHPTLGVIDVAIANGYELNELHGVQITTPTDNQGLFYNATSTLWENKSITTALGYTPVPTTRNITINGVTYDLSADRTFSVGTISGSGAAGQVTYWTGASAVSGSNNLFWDAAQSRLGIGTNAPTNPLHIAGVNDVISRIRSSTNTGVSSYLAANDINSTFEMGMWGSTRAGFGSIASDNAYLYGSKTLAITSLVDIRFGTGASVAERMRIDVNGNVGIGVTPTVRLQVTGDTLLRGSGNTNATTALIVQNSSSTNLLTVRNDGNVGIGTNAPVNALHIQTSSATAAPIQLRNTNSQGFATFYISKSDGTDAAGFGYINASNTTAALANRFVFYTFNNTPISFTRNSDFTPNLFIVGASGNVIVNGDTDIASSRLTVNSTTQGFLPPRMTTTQKNAISSPAAGLVVYDTTDNKHYGYDGTTWNAFY